MCIFCEHWNNQIGGCMIHNTIPGGCKDFMDIRNKSEYNAIRPAHYRDSRKYEPKDVIRDWGLNFNTGSAVKYLSRAGRKGDIIEDLEKAKQFIQFEIDYLNEEKNG